MKDRPPYQKVLQNVNLPFKMRLPDFLIVGAQKAGTSALRALLSAHPQLFMASRELEFFSSRRNFSRGLSAYANYFIAARRDQVIGEKSPNLLYCEGAAQRIKNCLPECKIIILLRDPVERSYSHFRMSVRNFREALTFDDALSEEASRLKDASLDWLEYEDPQSRYSYLGRGIYVGQVKRFLETFGRERVLVLFHHDLRHDQISTLTRVYDFLEVGQIAGSSSRISDNGETLRAPTGAQSLVMRKLFGRSSARLRRVVIRVLPQSDIPPMTIEIRKYLEEYFRKPNQLLEQYLGYLPPRW